MVPLDKNSCMGYAACLRSVVKSLGGRRVLNGVSLSVREGEVLVLAGLNGAGKSTTVRVLLGLLKPEGGTVRVLGVEPGGRGWDVAKRFIGYLPEDAQPYARLTGYENLLFFARLYASSEDEAREMVERAADMSGLPREALSRRAGGYSKGMKRRLLLARTLMVKPKLAILDEPTSGLDVVHAVHVRNIIKNYARSYGVTVLLSSHNMLEVEYLCDRIGIIHKGVLRLEGDPKKLLHEYNVSNLEELFSKLVEENA